MKRPTLDWDAAVAFARNCLNEMFDAFDDLEKEIPVRRQELANLTNILTDLHAQEPPLGADARVCLKTYHLERAWYNGLMPDGCEQEISPYIAKIEHMIETSTRCSVTYQALRSHGASLLGSDLEICPQLRIFMNEVLRGQRMPPLTLGAPKVSPGRDPVIYAIMVDICLGFCVSPTRNKASASRESACDILAAAMPRAGRLPKTYGSLERIWIKGQREY